MHIIRDKESGKVLEVLRSTEELNAYTFEVICETNLKKMRKARDAFNKRIDELADKEVQTLMNHRVSVERALVYALERKSVSMQKGLYYALVEIQPNGCFCYKSDIAKLKLKYKIEDTGE